MMHRDYDELLDQNLSGGPPGQVFRAKVLLDSTAALARRRQLADRWRMVKFSVAAALIAGVSFLLGRGSVPRQAPGPVPGPVVAAEADTVVVSRELVAWLDAAQLFRQLAMEDRMARAVERAGKLLPRAGGVTSIEEAERFLIARSEDSDSAEGLDPHPSFDIINRIMAQSSGGYSHADGTD